MPKRIVIIGGGASGVLLAAHLTGRGDPDGEVTIVERRATLGAGAAYATNHPDHLLNVRASNMSAFPDDPGHFAAWLRTVPDAAASIDVDGFAPRRLYRDYLAGLIAPPLARGRLHFLNDEARLLSEHAEGVTVSCAGGRTVEADVAVLATGNEGPSFPPAAWRIEGWDEAVEDRFERDAPVVVVGTGLTMADRVIALLHGGHRGAITAVSRRGLMPQAHGAVGAAPLEAAELGFGAPLSRTTAWLRRRARTIEAQGGDWRSVVDALRPHTQTFWRRLAPDDQRRFLRHARPFWDMHRHRIAPSAAASLAEARARGQLRLLAAHVAGFEEDCAGGVRVHLAQRKTRAAITLEAAVVFECRGRSTDVTRTENPILRQLLGTGTARPDGTGLGLDVTEHCAVIGADGAASERLFALGPVTAGTFWEVVAIPDIRQQAAALANRLTGAMADQGSPAE